MLAQKSRRWGLGFSIFRTTSTRERPTSCGALPWLLIGYVSAISDRNSDGFGFDRHFAESTRRSGLCLAWPIRALLMLACWWRGMHIQITARLEYVQRQLVVKQIGDQYYMLHTVYTVAAGLTLIVNNLPWVCTPQLTWVLLFTALLWSWRCLINEGRVFFYQTNETDLTARQ